MAPFCVNLRAFSGDGQNEPRASAAVLRHHSCSRLVAWQPHCLPLSPHTLLGSSQKPCPEPQCQYHGQNSKFQTTIQETNKHGQRDNGRERCPKSELGDETRRGQEIGETVVSRGPCSCFRPLYEGGLPPKDPTRRACMFGSFTTFRWNTSYFHSAPCISPPYAVTLECRR